jgi:hypothetical protein
MEKRTNNSASIGELFAGNVFPINVDTTLKQEKLKKRAYVPVRNVGTTRLERVLFDEFALNHQPIRVLFPYITKEAMAMTMENYRQYVAQYNDDVFDLNMQINIHNAKVEEYTTSNKEKLTEVQKEFSRLFILKNRKTRTKEYNEKVEVFNQEYGMLVPKRKHQTIKYATEIIFQQILHSYSIQISKKTTEWIKLGVTEPTPVDQITINTWQVATKRRNDIQAIDVCTKTVANHRERLEEAGILVDYLFRGNKKGLKFNINSQILVVFDAKTGKYSNAENQSLTSETCKKLPDSNEDTRTSKNNIKKIENGIADFLEKGTPSAESSFVFLHEHPKQVSEVQTGGAAKTVKISNDLQKSIMHPQELAELLSSGAFNNYQRIDKRVLYHEAMYGTLTRDEFKQLIIQEFFCNAAKLYRGKNVFIGSWKKAINSYLEKLFLVRNGNDYFLIKKELMVDKMDEMLWRINNAQRWFIKTGINPLFPSDYFDFTRTSKQEIGFEYTKKAYQNHLKYIETKPKLAKSVKKKAEIRGKNLTQAKKFDIKVNQFFKGRVSLEKLTDYVNENLPTNFQHKLTEVLISISTKYTC